MRTKAIVFFAALVFVMLFSVLAISGNVRQSATIVAPENQQQVQAPAPRAACTMAKTTGVPAIYGQFFQTGVGIYTYFNPALICTPPIYPLEINAFSFTLYDPGGYIWPAMVDVVVYAVAQPPDSCTGPGAELCRYPVVATQTVYGAPNVGTYTFPTPCCVTGPFFIGLEYTAGTAGSTPSVLCDNQTAIVCDNWARWVDGAFYEWNTFWTPPPPGYPLFWVGGETVSANCQQQPCDWQPGDPYKMHFPQLPNDTGWDVNATQPLVLADDWQCSQTGWVKDIHFWGSWRNGVVGRVLYFVLSIHSDIPANPPQVPYSRPGQTLWEREVTQFTVTPVDPPSMEGWYDPSINEILFNDHGAYFQYNICFPDSLDWFRQVRGTIYWLNISAVIEDPQNTRWGWKSTVNHFNDDAVWAQWGLLNWIDLWEPSQPIQNQFWAQFDPQGMLMAGGGTGFFGQGWYLYESGWWNIWFYDHPFTYDRGKVIRLDFMVAPMIPQPSRIVFAVNWSTDRWSIDQPPQDSMPPLPGVPESYIGRDTLLAGTDLQGHYVFDYLIRDYNPEWVSVDVMGNNIMIEGTIAHECRQSLDLAFVITNGDTAMACDCNPGDANGDAIIDISDAVYLIGYIFTPGSPAPTPYPICSGDANCDCLVDISDAVYLVQYIFVPGSPPPCSCNQWLINCGPPLR